MTDLVDMAEAVDEMIAERPCTVTVYRSAHGAESPLSPFTGRLDEKGVEAGRFLTPQHEPAVAVATFILLCPQAHRVVQSRDRLKIEREGDVTSWFKVLSTNDFGYKQECVLISTDNA